VLNTPLAVPLTSRAISGLPWSKAGRKMSSNAPPGQAAAAVGSASVWISATDPKPTFSSSTATTSPAPIRVIAHGGCGQTSRVEPVGSFRADAVALALFPARVLSTWARGISKWEWHPGLLPGPFAAPCSSLQPWQVRRDSPRTDLRRPRKL